MQISRGIKILTFLTPLFLGCRVGRVQPVAGTSATLHPNRDITFIATSDCHYDAFENEDRNDRNRDTIREMNAITSSQWPGQIGGGPIKRPLGVLVLGDVIDDGDRVLRGEHQTPRQWSLFQADFGLDGRDGLLDYPVFETWGNHDGPPVGKDKHGFSSQAQLRNRNRLRKEKGRLTGLSPNELHYSWDWDDVHFVQLGIYPADVQHPKIRYNPVWHHPQKALTFLKEDLTRNIGKSGRPVVLMSHCGIDADWWHEEDKEVFYDAVKDYNVLLYLYGHSGTGYRKWSPSGEGELLDCVNTGQTENGFFVIQITDDKIRLAYRAKRWIHKETSDTKPLRTWDGKWQWKHIVEKSCSKESARQMADLQ